MKRILNTNYRDYEPFVGDTNTKIILDVDDQVPNISLARINFIRPDGSRGHWNAFAEEETIFHITVSTDLNMPGQWLVQAYIESPTWTGQGFPAKMRVRE